MAGVQVKSYASVVPMIYAYTTPGVPAHDGWTKIGYTERDVDRRIREQTHTANIAYQLEWKRKPGTRTAVRGISMTMTSTIS